MDTCGIKIGKNCEDIIKDYVYQLTHSDNMKKISKDLEKYNTDEYMLIPYKITLPDVFDLEVGVSYRLCDITTDRNEEISMAFIRRCEILNEKGMERMIHLFFGYLMKEKGLTMDDDEFWEKFSRWEFNSFRDDNIFNFQDDLYIRIEEMENINNNKTELKDYFYLELRDIYGIIGQMFKENMIENNLAEYKDGNIIIN